VTRRTRCLFLGLSFAMGVFGRDEYARMFDQTVPWHARQRIYLEHKLGDVAIKTHARSDVLVHAEIRVLASNKEEAKTFADRVGILIEPSSSELLVRTRYPDRSDTLWGMRGISYCVRYEVVIPESAPLRVRNSFGSVSVSGVKSDTEISTSHGDLDFRDGHGAQRLQNAFAATRVANNQGNVTIETTNGVVDASGINGELSVRDRFGNVTATRISNGVTITNSNGAVNVADSGGPGRIRNAFGAVTVRTLRGDLIVNNGNGRVEATGIDGRAELNTTFGHITFSDIKRGVVVSANNTKIVGSRVGGPITIGTSFGAVDVTDVQDGLKVESRNGSVTVSNIRGPANIRTSFGAVEASNVAGMLVVGNTNGSVKAWNTRGAQVSTSFAPVLLDGVSGPLQVENRNGRVDASLMSKAGCQPVAIRTSHAPVSVRLKDGANYKIAAQTSFGKIHTDYPLTMAGALSGNSVTGVIGNGSCEMQLVSVNGNIDILK
jgi:hypothetical protein